MTTYPLSEPATIYRESEGGEAGSNDKVARGSLSDCAEILEGWSTEDRARVRVEMDDMSLRYGTQEIEELLAFLREEDKDARGGGQGHTRL
jgi:hypothetical protein